MQGQKNGDVITANYYSGCLSWLRHEKINTIKSRPGINEFVAKERVTEGNKKRVSLSPELLS